MGSLTKLPLLIIYLFVFLGPLGNILTPASFPSPFRTFYFLLPLFPFFYKHINANELKTLLLFFPFLLYCLISSYFAEFLPYLHPETTPFFRCILLLCQTLFMFGAAFYLRDRSTGVQKNRLIRLYLYAFFLSLIIGYTFFIGFYLGSISLKTIERFSVITQFGYGILRFSPGSYPNEYGISASFTASILTLLIAEKNTFSREIGFSRKFLYLFYFLTFIALILSTTRAAYIAYIMSLLYLCFISQKVRRILLIVAAFIPIAIILLQKHFSFFFKVLAASFTMLNTELNSFGIRLHAWNQGLKEFEHSSWFGSGYGSFHSIHNVYLEFFIELGIIGITLLFVSFIFYLLKHHHSIKATFLKKWAAPSDFFSNQVIILGLIHIFWFAASNHNLNHHLTWMIFLLFNLGLVKKQPPNFKPRGFGTVSNAEVIS